MNKQKSQSGSAHLVIIIIVFLALIGALGFVYWQNFLQTQTPTDQQRANSMTFEEKTQAALNSIKCKSGEHKETSSYSSSSSSGTSVSATCVTDKAVTTIPKIYAINQKVTFSDGVGVTVTGIQRNYLPTYFMSISGKTYTSETKPASGKEYIAITLKIDNGSGKTYDYGSTYGWRVQDSNKFQYDEAMFVYSNESDLLGSGHLGDGGTVSGKILYEIPSDSSDLKLIIGTATFNLQ